MSAMVSVRLITYNHAAFIREAMEGIFIQKTTFPVEVVVGDDFSTDDTLQIIKSYQSTDNITIRILERPVGGEYYQERKKYSRLYNYVDVLRNCRGKYIAILDGDDYWTDPLKLQKQFDFLEKNPRVVLCSHCSFVLRDGLLERDSFESGTYDFNYIVMKGRVGQTASYVLRNFFATDWGDKVLELFLMPNMLSGDRLLQVCLSVRGDLVLLDEYMAVYRKHSEGVMASDSFIQKHNIALYYLFKNVKGIVSSDKRDIVENAQLYWLDNVFKRDVILKNKILCCKEAFSLRFWLGLWYVFLFPLYSIKVVLYRLRTNSSTFN